jgi:hypothetical protein
VKGVTHRVRVVLSYRAASRTIVLTPSRALRHHTTYLVTVRRVTDPRATRGTSGRRCPVPRN